MHGTKKKRILDPTWMLRTQDKWFNTWSFQGTKKLRSSSLEVYRIVIVHFIEGPARMEEGDSNSSFKKLIAASWLEEVLSRFLVTGSSSLSKISSSRKYPSLWLKDHNYEALENLMPRTNPQERRPNSCHFKLLLDTTFY